MTVRTLALGFAALALSTLGFSDTLSTRYVNGIVAIVEDRPITVDEVRREIAPLISQIQSESRTEAEYAKRLESLQADVIQSLVDRVLVVKAFYKEGLDDEGNQQRQIPASYIDKSIAENIATQFEGDRSKFLAYLRSRGMTQREYRREVEEEMVFGYMRGQLRKSMSGVSPVKIEEYYKANQQRFFQDEAVKLRLIQLSRGKLSEEQLAARADEVMTKLKAGEKFEDLAKQYSQDARRTRGGDWGWQKRGDLKKEFVEKLFVLEKGQNTQPIVLAEGIFILYVEEKIASGIQPIDSVRDQIEGILTQQFAREAQEKWLTRLRREGYVKYF